MQGGIEQREEQYIPPRRGLRHAEAARGATCHQQDDDTREEEADASEEHLAACLIGGDLELGKSELDEGVCPSPHEGGGEGEQGDPEGALEKALGL